MEDDLQKIEIETAKIRLERERLALRQEMSRANMGERVAESAHSAIRSTKLIGVSTLKTSATIAKYLLSALIGITLMSSVGALWVIATKSNWTTHGFGFNFGYWLGSGGAVLVLTSGIAGMLYFKYGQGEMLGIVSDFFVSDFFVGVKNGENSQKSNEVKETSFISNKIAQIRSRRGPFVALFYVLWKHLGLAVTGILLLILFLYSNLS